VFDNQLNIYGLFDLILFRKAWYFFVHRDAKIRSPDVIIFNLKAIKKPFCLVVYGTFIFFQTLSTHKNHLWVLNMFNVIEFIGYYSREYYDTSHIVY